MIAAPVQCDVDGIPKGSHYVRVPMAIGCPHNPSSATRPTGRVNCDRSAMAGFAAAYG